jgi:RNA polymerase-binding transcription factor DksA
MNTTTDDSLRAARARLLARGAQLQDRIHRVQQDLGRESNPLPKDSADAAIVVEYDEILQAIDETSHRELLQIDRALERIEAGTFARCEVCGEDIETARLIAVPYTSRCRHCAQDE